MTYAPASITAAAKVWTAAGGVNAGIVGDAAHRARASYHNGRDAIDQYGRTRDTDYSIELERDWAGLTNAAAALDLKAGALDLAAASVRLVRALRASSALRADVREVIYSPDGLAVERWSGVDNLIHTGPGNGDDSHLWHTHISWFRDSEARDKAAVIRAALEDDMEITAIKGEDWKPKVVAGETGKPIRAAADRSLAPFAYVPHGKIVRTILEGRTTDGNVWRTTKWNGRVGYLLRIDFDPLVPGGDADVDAGLTAYIDRAEDLTPYSQADLDTATDLGLQRGQAAGEAVGAQAVKQAAIDEAAKHGG